MKSAPPARRGLVHGKNNLTPTMSLQHSKRIDEVVLNALAFSTLLSSQETDAHHQVRFRVPFRGNSQTLLLGILRVKLEFPVCFPKLH
jgi:hypothetical protein